MNTNDKDPLTRSLERLRSVEPPQELRDANRRAVLQSRRSHQGETLARTASVPMHWFIAIAAMLLTSVTINLFQLDGWRDGRTDRPAKQAPTPIGSSNLVAVSSTDATEELWETQRYISGVGVVDRTRIYRK